MISMWDKRDEDKWTSLKEGQLRCKNCMNDAPYEWCCKHHCGQYDFCEICEAYCREGIKLCEK